MALSGCPGDAAQSDAVIKRHIVANYRSFADHDTHAMVNKKPPANAGPGMNFYASKHPTQMRDKAAEQAQAMPPQPISEMVKLQRMEARITKKDLGA